MSWGERSCYNFTKPCPYNPTFATCHTGCNGFVWNKKRYPDDDRYLSKIQKK